MLECQVNQNTGIHVIKPSITVENIVLILSHLNIHLISQQKDNGKISSLNLSSTALFTIG